MGMSASQARLLFITSRQNDVSAKMQRISNQNIVLARDSEEVAEKYNKMLTIAKSNSSLVSNETSVPTNLSYDAMMGASGANSGSSLYAITNSNRQVVLSPAIAAKLSALGGATSGSAADFISKYPASNIKQFITDIAGSTIANAYSEASSGSKSSSFSINDLFSVAGGSNRNNSYISKKTVSDQTSKDFNTFSRSFDNRVSNNNGQLTVWRYAGTSSTWQKDAQLAEIGQQNVTIGDLYNCAGTKDGMVLLGGARGPRKDGDERSQGPGADTQNSAIKNLETLSEGLCEQLVNALVQKGLDKTKVMSVVSSANQSVLKSYSQVSWSDSFWQSQGQDNNYVAYNEGAMGSCMNFASSAKNIVAMYGAADDDWMFCVNAGSYAKDLIDSVMSKLGTTDTTGYTGSVSTSAQYTIRTTYLTPTNNNTNDGSNLVVSDASKANYYAELYKKLAAGGWTVDADVTDTSKLQEKFKNGTYMINGQNVKNVDSISEVCTEEEAEAYYDTEKAKIQRKEKQLDTELTKLQTEYSSLTNDYNSVKSILDANIQRSFTYCQNG